jgi:hypothetical protein
MHGGGADLPTNPRRPPLSGLHPHTPCGELAFLEARHRAHARVEDRIRTEKDMGQEMDLLATPIRARS